MLYDLNLRDRYHCFQNCPLGEGISEERLRITTEQIARDKGMQACETCVLMDGPSESRPDHLPGGNDVEPTAKIGVALSGGGHRATLFGLGVLMYLAHARRNEDMSVNNDVLEISSVSGGSIANGYVAQTLDYQWAKAEEFDEVARQLASQLAQRGTLFAPWWARVYVGFVGLLAILSLGGVTSVLFFRGPWSVLGLSLQ